jgi:response regulator RpfG family c-di-GMP phosphodiesterase
MLFGLFTTVAMGVSIYTIGALQYDKEHNHFLLQEYIRQEQILARFPETNPNYIFKVNHTGEIEYMNPASYKLLNELELGSGKAYRLLPPDFKAIIRTSLEKNDFISLETKIQTKVIHYLISRFSDERSAIFAGNDITYLRQIERELKDLNVNLESKVVKRTDQLTRTQDATIFCLAGLAEIRDPETGQHLERTRLYIQAVARKLSENKRHRDLLTDSYIQVLYKSAPLHDIGKVGIDDHILLKPGKLTEDEFKIMKRHAHYSARALRKAEKSLGADSFLRIAIEIAASHHEKWDGTGYPRRLKGEAIPVSARLMAIADVYDALISRRVYKEPFSHKKSRSIILEGRGSHFDPDVVDAFMLMEDRIMDIAKNFPDGYAV